MFWESIALTILSKKYICTCAPFGTVSEIGLFHCAVPKLLTRNKTDKLRDLSLFSLTDPYDSILGLLYRSRYFFFQVAPQFTRLGGHRSRPTTSRKI
jgi:hypothetical protein